MAHRLLTLLAARAAGTPRPALPSDTFTGAGSTALASHTMDAGSGWTLGSGSWTVTSGQVSSSTNGSYALTPANCSGGMTVSVDIPSFTAGSVSDHWLLFGWTDANNYYYADAYLDSQDAVVYVRLRKVAGGVTSNLVNLTSVSGTSGTLKVVTTPTTAAIYWNGAQKGTTSSGYTEPASPKVGIKHGGGGTTVLFDNFLVTQP